MNPISKLGKCVQVCVCVSVTFQYIKSKCLLHLKLTSKGPYSGCQSHRENLRCLKYLHSHVSSHSPSLSLYLSLIFSPGSFHTHIVCFWSLFISICQCLPVFLKLLFFLSLSLSLSLSLPIYPSLHLSPGPLRLYWFYGGAHSMLLTVWWRDWDGVWAK